VAGRYALNSVKKAIEGDDAARRVRYHVKALAQSAEALAVKYTQLKERLNAVESTQRISRKYKDKRRRHLQHRGVLKVSNAQKMVKKKEEQEEERLRKKLARLKKKRQAKERITTNN
jgi:predicted phage tail protein